MVSINITKNIVTNDFMQRQEVINDFLENEYEYDENQGFFLSKKKYYSFHYLQDFVEKYMNILNYKSAGLHFKNIDNFCCNYLYIFPENRTDSKILQNGTIIDDITNTKITTKYMGFLKYKNNLVRRIDIRFVPYKYYYSALLYFTGSREFNRNIRKIAKSKGYKLSEYGLTRIIGKSQYESTIPIKSEKDIFNILNIPYLEPEYRT